MIAYSISGGGSGFIGSHLTTVLASNGFNPIVLSRMPGIKRLTWHELENKGLPSDTLAVVNLAGQNVLDPTRRWTPGFKQNVWNSRINTTTTLNRAIQNSKIKPCVFINVSGVSLYKPNPAVVYTEDDKGEDYDFMSKLCLHWEKAAILPDAEPSRQVRGDQPFNAPDSTLNSFFISDSHQIGSCDRSRRWHDPIVVFTILARRRRENCRWETTSAVDSHRRYLPINQILYRK